MFLHYKALSRYRRPSNVSPFVRCARALFLFISLTLLLTISELSQAQEKQPDPVDEVVRVRTDLITVPLFVMDRDGRRVSGLRQGEFVLRDNGRVVETSYFSSGAERVALLFALDSSGSLRDIIERQRETALALFSRFGGSSRVAVMRFDEEAHLVTPLTTDSDEARAAFKFPALTGRRTAIFDAGLEALRSFRGPDNAERRIVILISDGLDTASRTAASKVIDEAVERAVSFYVIHLPLFEPRGGRLRVRPPSKGFRDLAEKTGGKYFMLGDARTALALGPKYDLSPIFQAIEEDLRGQYLLGYYPPEAVRDNLPHRIEVSLAGDNNRMLRVRTLRSGYLLKNVE